MDPVELDLPDYFAVVKHPMDLGTVSIKLNDDEYLSLDGFVADVRLTFVNAMLYSENGSAVYNMARELKIFLENLEQDVLRRLHTALQHISRPLSFLLRLLSSDDYFRGNEFDRVSYWQLFATLLDKMDSAQFLLCDERGNVPLHNLLETPSASTRLSELTKQSIVRRFTSAHPHSTMLKNHQARSPLSLALENG